MKVDVVSTPLRDLVVLEHEVFQDERGFFREVYRSDIFQDLGLPHQFVQMNHSRSARNVVRGLHFQWEPPMGKLMRVTSGSAFLVAVDIRHDSPTLGEWFGIELDGSSNRQVWAPAGFARGFCVLSDFAEIQYLCTGTYNGEGESGILWNDPAIGIRWPVNDPVLSDKDQRAQTLTDWLSRADSRNFVYE